MTVPSLAFLLFAVVAACLFNLSGAPRWRRLVMLTANLAFLLSFAPSPVALIPYAGFLALGYALIVVQPAEAPGWVPGLAAAVLLAVFCWLKRYSFLPAPLFLSAPYVVIGLSYVFFRVMHLAIDARDSNRAQRPTFVDYLVYTLDFTALVSGPIQRYEDYYRMRVVAPLPLGAGDLGIAAERVITGLFKVWVMTVLVSLLQKHLTHLVLADGDGPVLGLGLGRLVAAASLVALYPVYLFFNFSGYTDFVIGIARLFRLQLPENFDRPFSASSFIEYWSRWHITLSLWLKTYVYSPLVTILMRRLRHPGLLPYAGVLALFVTFFLIGAWHGRTSEFIVFGLLNGLGMAVNQTWRIVAAERLGRKRFAALSRQPAYLFVGRGLTFTWVAFSLLWFWSSWGELSQFVASIGVAGSLLVWPLVALVAAPVLEGLQWGRAAALLPLSGGQPLVWSRYVRTAWLTALVCVTASVQNVVGGAAPDIVYKSF